MGSIQVVDEVWARIQRHAGESFVAKTGLLFIYKVPGNYLQVIRGRARVNRSLSRTNFAKAVALMPADGPGVLKDRQGSSYTWAILMDPRIRQKDW